LRTVSERLEVLAGPQSIVARLGGDEFAILSAASEDIEDPERMARAVVAAMRIAVEIAGSSHYLGASVGIAEYPRHGDSAEALLKHADTALYEAKAAGRNGWRLFDHQLRTAIEHRKDIENNLRNAIANNELALHYQAIVEADTLKVAGFEGLMRWHSAVLGEVSPTEFIPVAEQSGLMTELGAWAISRACEEATAFGSQMEFSVNVSANQFRSPGFLAHVEGELNRCNIAPQRMILEITESVLVSNRTAARNLLFSLNRLGVQIAIDDFGTGYSSLGYLQHLPIAIVKIDRSFVAGMLEQRANRAVIRAVLGIGRDLGIKIVAEGVETEGQAKALRDEGCRFMQGFLYSRPKPLTEAISDLATGLLGRPPGATAGRKTA
jgi:predicted signal transduction protein with EAL and GGDEF domain